MSKILDALSDAEIKLQSRQDPISRIAGNLVAATISKLIVPLTDPVVRKKIHGADLMLRLSHDLPRYVARYPFYDTVLPAFAKFLLSQRPTERKMVLVDVGANVGDTAKLVSAVTGSENVRLICIEADEAYLPLLRENTLGLDVSIHNVIAAATTRQAEASIARSSSGTSSISQGTEQREAVALDDLLGKSEIDIIKIDTDGYEAEVLRGLAKTFERCAPAIFIEFSPAHILDYGGVAPSLVLSLLRAAGYEQGIVYDHLGYPMGIATFTDAAIAHLVNYCQSKAGFYVDILLTKDVGLLSQFYDHDLRRYTLASATIDHASA